MGRLTKIEAKPEQSKHLETATARVCDLSVDWVQQRGQEVYNPSSRIPTVAFGTPLEDAERRDLTINALFYNLRTRLIEDQTGKGLSDLGLVPGHPKRIRTPLEPFQTFRDDPLRVVRAVRFAARFGREFELDDEMVRAIERDEIRRALLDPKKISRERVGAELDKMLLGRDPEYAFELIERLKLHRLVFLYDHDSVFVAKEGMNMNQAPSRDELEGLVKPDLPDTVESVVAAKILTRLLAPASTTTTTTTTSGPEPSLPPLHPLLHLEVVRPQPLASGTSLTPYPEPTPVPVPSPTDFAPSSSPRRPASFLSEIFPHTLKRLYLSCGLLPLYDFSSVDKRKVVWVGEKVVRDGIKGPTVDVTWTKRARDGAKVVSDLVRATMVDVDRNGPRTDEQDRVDIGMLLRNPSVHDGQHVRWNVTILWTLVVELVRSRHDPAASVRIVQMYNRFVERILELGLESKAFEPPLLDGKAINSLYPVTRSNPAMVQVLHLVTARQLAHPHATRQDLERWFLESEQARVVEDLCKATQASLAGTKRKGGQK
ncbi:hypothetical protein JCM10212_002912 [Sporobolomyces blumeae]